MSVFTESELHILDKLQDTENEITTLRRRLANSEEKVADAIRCLDTVSGKAELGASVVRAERTEVMNHVAEGFDVIKKYAKSEAARLRQQADDTQKEDSGDAS